MWYLDPMYVSGDHADHRGYDHGAHHGARDHASGLRLAADACAPAPPLPVRYR